MTVVCLDASVVAKWLITEEFSGNALALMHASTRRGIRMVVPPLIVSEVSSALHHGVRSGSFDVAEAVRRFDDFRQYELAIEARLDVPPLALRIAAELNQEYPYDAFYLALAELVDCDLWTADAAFHTAASPRYPRVKLLADYPVR